MRKNKLFLTLAIIVAIGFGAVFIYNAYLHIGYFLDARAAREDAAAMQDIFAEPIELIHPEPIELPKPPEPVQPAELPESARPFIEAIIEARELTGNDDIIAYLHIEGTNISNVVVHCHDNNFYLYHDIHRQRNVNGALFLDYLNSPDFTDRSSIVYGHNMRNGTMFHNIRYFMNAAYFNAHRYITVFTETEMLTYQAFAAFSTRIDFNYIQVEFRDDDDFLYLVNEIKRRSVHNSDIIVGADDRILILSTCTNTDADMRYVVVGLLVTE